MLKTSVALALTVSILTLSLRVPVFTQANALPDEGRIASAGDIPGRDMKAKIASESEKFKRESAGFDPERAEKERVKQTTKSGLSKKDKTMLAVFAIAIGVLVVLLVKYGKNCKTTTPRNCNIGTDENCYCEEYEEESRATR